MEKAVTMNFIPPKLDKFFGSSLAKKLPTLPIKTHLGLIFGSGLQKFR